MSCFRITIGQWGWLFVKKKQNLWPKNSPSHQKCFLLFSTIILNHSQTHRHFRNITKGTSAPLEFPWWLVRWSPGPVSMGLGWPPMVIFFTNKWWIWPFEAKLLHYLRVFSWLFEWYNQRLIIWRWKSKKVKNDVMRMIMWWVTVGYILFVSIKLSILDYILKLDHIWKVNKM